MANLGPPTSGRHAELVAHLTLARVISSHAQRTPNKLAVVFRDQRLSYSDLDQRCNRLGNAVATLGVRRGDKVATLLDNCLELLELYWAMPKIGAVLVPLSTLLASSSLQAMLELADVKLLVMGGASAPLLPDLRPQLPKLQNYVVVGRTIAGCLSWELLLAGAPAHPPEAMETVGGDDLCHIMFSSGTTGQPKGIMLTHATRYVSSFNLAAAFRFTTDSVALHSGSLVFNGMILSFLPTFMLGGTYILMEAFDPIRQAHLMQQEHVTHIVLVPSQIRALLTLPEFTAQALPHLQAIISVGAPLLVEDKRRLIQALPDRLFELYGLTEGPHTVLDRSCVLSKTKSVGHSQTPSSSIYIADEAGNPLPPGQVGEIYGQGSVMTHGYYGRPDLTAELFVENARGRWIRTGDLGYLDADGFLVLVDRKMDMIISGGVNVYPKDIESIIATHPAVLESAVYGVPDDKWGEAAIAAVILKPDAKGTILPAELKAWVNARVGAKFQRLKDLEVVPALPRNVAFKVLKRDLTEDYQRRHPRAKL